MAAPRRLMPEIDLATADIPYGELMALEVTMADFWAALGEVGPSALREVFTEIPGRHLGRRRRAGRGRRRLCARPSSGRSSYAPVLAQAGVRPPKGILLTGPPGTGKTLLAKAVARESGVNFISVKGPELLSSGSGSPRKGVREVFRRARQAAPCIVFFDEIDTLAPQRGGGGENHVSERVVSQLLTELDGIEELRGVVILATRTGPTSWTLLCCGPASSISRLRPGPPMPGPGRRFLRCKPGTTR